MPRITDLAKIINPEAVTPGPGPGPSGDDWINRVNTAIKNFKELIEAARQFKGNNEGAQVQEPKFNSTEMAPTPAPGLAEYIRLAIQAGYGDTPIGKLIEQVSPHTLKQIVGVLKNARPGK